MPLINYLGKSKGFIERATQETIRKILLRFCHGLSILMYHRVTHSSLDPQLLTVTPERFAEHVAFLKKTGRLLTMGQFEDILQKSGSFPPRSTLITFDDGYADNYKEALPILEQAGAEAFFFISTGNIGTRKEFWWDNLERIFIVNQTPKQLSIRVAGKTYDLPTDNPYNRAIAYRQFHKILKPLDLDTREKIIDSLLAWASLSLDGRETHRSMTKEEVKLLSESRAVHIGAHTKNHVMLSSLSREKQKTEMATAKESLENITGKTVDYFSYPFGDKNSYTKETIRICRELGFRVAFSGFNGIVTKKTNPFELPRVIARNWDITELQKNI